MKSNIQSNLPLKVISNSFGLLQLLLLLQTLVIIIVSEIPRVVESYTYHSFQKGVTCTSSHDPLQPKNLADLQTAVHFALKNNLTVKALGNLHSFPDIICTTGIPINMTRINHFSYDPTTTLATVGAGIILKDLLENLHVHGRALTSIPNYGEITVGGALGTGAFGASTEYPSTLSDQIVSVTVVDGLGNVRTITDKEEDFKALRVNLGLLGIIYEVVLNTTPQYKLQVHNYPVSDSILWNGKLDEIADKNDFLQFWWFPSSKQVVISVGNRVPTSTSGNCELHYISEGSLMATTLYKMNLELMQSSRDLIGSYLMESYTKLSLFKTTPGKTPFYTEAGGISPCLPVAVGYSHRMLSQMCKNCVWNHGEFSFFYNPTEIGVPKSDLPAALKTLREIVTEEYPTQFPINGIFFRYHSKSNAYMALNSDQQFVSIEWISAQRLDKSQPILGLPAIQAMGQALLDKHKGRPHWGKNGLYFSSREVVKRLHPQSNLAKFTQTMNKMDPHGVFLNDFGRRVRLESDEMTSLTEDIASHCALNDACICEKDLDCGNGGPKDYTCGNLIGYKVCKEKPNFFEDLKTLVSRQLIKTLSMQPDNEERIFKAVLSNETQTKAYEQTFRHYVFTA